MKRNIQSNPFLSRKGIPGLLVLTLVVCILLGGEGHSFKDKISPIKGIIIVSESESPRQEEANHSFYLSFSSSKLRVLTRKHIDKIINEQRLQASGLIDKDEMIRLGRVSGASHVLLFKPSATRDTNNGPPSFLYKTTLINIETSEIEEVNTYCLSHIELMYNFCPSLQDFILRLEAKRVTRTKP
jgi:hypothetical protein